MKKGDIIRFRFIRTDILLQLSEKPVRARAINGVSDEDELLLTGYVLSKSKGKEFCRDSRYKGEKPYIVKKGEIELVKEYNKLRVYFDGRCGYEYDTLEQVKDFISRVKFEWSEVCVFDPNGCLVYEANNV